MDSKSWSCQYHWLNGWRRPVKEALSRVPLNAYCARSAVFRKNGCNKWCWTSANLQLNCELETSLEGPTSARISCRSGVRLFWGPNFAPRWRFGLVLVSWDYVWWSVTLFIAVLAQVSKKTKLLPTNKRPMLFRHVEAVKPDLLSLSVAPETGLP